MAERPEVADLVRSFYGDVWESGLVGVAERILHPDLRFRGSVGTEKRGLEGFWEYFNEVRGAFAEYQCHILTLVSEGERAAARMRFEGWHRSPFLGIEPLHRYVDWQGAAFLEMRDGQLADIWVLGDVDALRAALKGES